MKSNKIASKLTSILRARWTHLSSIGSILASITTILNEYCHNTCKYWAGEYTLNTFFVTSQMRHPVKKDKFVKRDCLYFKHCMFYHYHVNPKILKILSPEFRVILNRYPESLTIEIEVEKNLNIFWNYWEGLALRKFGMHYRKTHKTKLFAVGFLCIFITLDIVNPKSWCGEMLGTS